MAVYELNDGKLLRVARSINGTLEQEYFSLIGLNKTKQKEGKTNTLKLKFVDLPPNVESAIVRAVYQHQLSKSLPDLEKPKQASSDDSS